MGFFDRSRSFNQPSARWVWPTLLFFGALLVLMGADELVTGEADTAGLIKYVPSHMAQPGTEPSNFYYVVSWHFVMGTILLLAARQQWRLRRAMLEEQSDSNLE